jgi:hypothetical protein
MLLIATIDNGILVHMGMGLATRANVPVSLEAPSVNFVFHCVGPIVQLFHRFPITNHA